MSPIPTSLHCNGSGWRWEEEVETASGCEEGGSQVREWETNSSSWIDMRLLPLLAHAFGLEWDRER